MGTDLNRNFAANWGSKFCNFHWSLGYKPFRHRRGRMMNVTMVILFVLALIIASRGSGGGSSRSNFGNIKEQLAHLTFKWLNSSKLVWKQILSFALQRWASRGIVARRCTTAPPCCLRVRHRRSPNSWRKGETKSCASSPSTPTASLFCYPTDTPTSAHPTTTSW